MADFISFDADIRSFETFVNEVIKVTGDLRLPFIQIGTDIYKSNKKLFLLKSKGKFIDLAPSTKLAKTKKLGSPYPILRGFTGRLEKSITKNTDRNAVFEVSKTSFSIGTRAKSKKGFLYPLALQEGTRKMPARPFLFIDPPRVKRWTQIIRNHFDDRYQEEGWTS